MIIIKVAQQTELTGAQMKMSLNHFLQLVDLYLDEE